MVGSQHLQAKPRVSFQPFANIKSTSGKPNRIAYVGVQTFGKITFQQKINNFEQQRQIGLQCLEDWLNQATANAVL
jgi:hypothetical protein